MRVLEHSREGCAVKRGCAEQLLVLASMNKFNATLRTRAYFQDADAGFSLHRGHFEKWLWYPTLSPERRRKDGARGFIVAFTRPR